MEKIPKEKTPVNSAALLRKEQIEKKKLQLAAKDGGAGNKVVPRSLSKMVKRPAGDIPLPAAKALKMRVPPPAKSIPKPPAGGRPTTAGKSLSGIVPTIEVVDEGIKEPVTPAGQTQTGTGSNAAGGDTTPQFDKDATSSRPNYQQYAKRMIWTLTRTEKEVVSAVHTVNIDRITSLLAEVILPDASPSCNFFVCRFSCLKIILTFLYRLISQVMLRVDGLQVPLRKKQEEVRDAQRRAFELIDVSQYNAIKYDMENKRRELE
ncbi:uncharacterized protein LOC110717261 isoform X1 [Chenopodium quinoa]|uniref:uncharacterized protein LOC110717261 isoform X1 n=1 Tax=Chenopodium quinoa TaxID=63459 RepID=UPI000B784523|nr:uncharacterized protein LOC110717261 isoform X1 [Chenopodium quinoa]XP_021751613.1 uncharacterized protein LOC110717261 isoform X1 [Chenopodium quinoa]